ncbi:GNAT family N-acetyltransferase [Pseudoroseomonas cervicalis]
MDDDYAARIAANEAWVWDAGGLLALLVLERRADHLWLDNIAVAPEAQGRGLGRRLIRFAVAEAQRLGLPELRLLTNAAMAGNLALYPRLGFTEVARRHDEGFDRVFFQAKLEAIKA